VSPQPPLEEYLGELAAGLPAAGRLRSRVLAEAEDHLREGIAARVAAGVPAAAAEAAALSAFGRAEVVARSITVGAATGAVRRAFMVGAVLLVVVIAGSDLVTSSFYSNAAGWLADGPGTVITWVIAQVALVAGAVSATRVAAYTLGRAGTAQLYIARGMLVVVLCAAVTIPMDGIGILTVPGGLRPGPMLLIIAAMGAGVTAAAYAAQSAMRAEACLRTLGASQPPDTSLAEDICGAAGRLYLAAQRHVPAAAPLLTVVARPVTRTCNRIIGRAPLLPDWLDNRRHPWRFAAVALAPLAALTIAYGIVQGVLIAAGAATWGSTAFLPLLLAAVECTLALAGYALLGPYLGLR
jgi:hypothetical protein